MVLASLLGSSVRAFPVLGAREPPARQIEATPCDRTDLVETDARIEQVAGILLREDLRFQTHASGDSFRLLFGTAAVFIHFRRCQDDSLCLTLTAPVVSGIDEDCAGRPSSTPA